MLQKFYAVAFTHKFLSIEQIGKLHREGEVFSNALADVKKHINVSEIVYLSTCNRVELYFFSNEKVNELFLKKLFKYVPGNLVGKELNWAVEHAKVYRGEDALRHLFNVTGSIDSLIVGEREIITQVRQAFEHAEKLGLTGDFSREVFRLATETAKKIYSQTKVAFNPVSVTSLAFRKLMEYHLPSETVFLIVGAGQTNSVLTTYLVKQGYKNFIVTNRSLENAERLGKRLNAPFFQLKELPSKNIEFDVLICCTSSESPVVTEKIWSQISGKKQSHLILDLSVPCGIEDSIFDKYKPAFIGIESLKSIARQNLEQRQKEVDKCKIIVDDAINTTIKKLELRELELSMQFVPKLVKEVRKKATEEVFAHEINQFSKEQKDTLEKILDYLEKKYIAIPMKIAKKSVG